MFFQEPVHSGEGVWEHDGVAGLGVAEGEIDREVVFWSWSDDGVKSVTKDISFFVVVPCPCGVWVGV